MRAERPSTLLSLFGARAPLRSLILAASAMLVTCANAKAHKDMWHGLLQAAADGSEEQWPRWVREMACNEVRFLDAVRLLLRYSMIETQESESGTYSVHPVVHKWVSQMQKGDERRESVQLALMLIGLSVPSHDTREYWSRHTTLAVLSDMTLMTFLCWKMDFSN
ncbi:uncharacterized protein B0I36DRAFT_337113 [Microdochium trichocladiopsis]|uniref:Uncharacterized protein n=1 Tax=Microdochium trichocladiopsis TaxID=1682393 RepID=A0A9P8XSS1_9PEZI|nr:uncharacterized protein B0I36DRAFT_337113 [Microdochium trichocladiopsis]KAH7016243.1 hypothetical protein B0I36DRAFT_337113 [Microdochium trichocladiopsis]